MNYAHEVRQPEVPACTKSVITLHFDGQIFKIQTAAGILKTYPAVSGKSINGKFSYSTERQKIANQGPIPESQFVLAQEPKHMREAVFLFMVAISLVAPVASI